MKRLAFSIAILVASLLTAKADAAEVNAAEARQQANENTVYIVGGSLTGTNSALLWDMAKLMDDGANQRVLPILGRGSWQATNDVLFLAGIDAATVQADVLEFFIDLGIFPNLRKNVRYISALHDEEVHIVVRRDSGISDIKQLEGKKVNFGPSTSGTFLTSSVIFDKFQLSVDALTDAYDFGLQKLIDGEIDAIVRVAGAPTSFLEDVPFEDGLAIIPIDDIGGPYKTAKVTSDQYPGLIAQGVSVDTVSVPSLLVAYNHLDGPRRARMDKFVGKFRETLPEFQSGKSFHPKWAEVDIDQTVSGWVRWGNVTPDP